MRDIWWLCLQCTYFAARSLDGVVVWSNFHQTGRYQKGGKVGTRTERCVETKMLYVKILTL